MVRATFLALAGAASLLGTAASAADLPPPLPPPVYRAPVAVETGGWYLRGDVGVGLQSFKSFEHHQTNSAFVWPDSWTINQKEIGDAAFVGFGVGYSWNNWLRFDVTAEYRMKAKFKVLGSYSGLADFCTDANGADGTCFDAYDGFHSAWVALVNAYVDLGTWWCVTPFIGAGVGGAWHKVTALTDVGYIADGSTGFGYASGDGTITDGTTTSNKWTFAWALHAGLAYNVSQNFKVEFAYRYLNMGTVDTPIINCSSAGCQTNGPRAFYSFTQFDSQDFRIGLRWMLQPDAPAMPVYPLMRKG
jgi:opacity protein-like surface antigen